MRPPIPMGVATIRRRLEASDLEFVGRSHRALVCPIACLLAEAGAHSPKVTENFIDYYWQGRRVIYTPSRGVQKVIRSVDSLGNNVPVPRQYVLDVCEGILAGEI